MKTLSLGAASLICLAGLATASTPLQPEEAAPPISKAGWLPRLSAAPARLAFWKKEIPSEAPSSDSLSASSEKTVTKQKTVAVTPPSPAAKPDIAPRENRISLRRFNPFAKPASSQTADSPASATRPTGFENAEKHAQSSNKKDFITKSDPAVTPQAATTEKPGFFTRLRTSDKKKLSEQSPLSPAKPEKLASANDKKAVVSSHSTASPPSGEKKPSFWTRIRMAAAAKTEAKPNPTKLPATLPPLETELNADTFVITKDESPFYTFGPNQATPPDDYLSTGTLVSVKNKSWGWAEIQLSDGRTGVVAKNALRAATPFDLVPASHGPALFAAAPKTRPSSNYVIPPAPLPELPTEAPFQPGTEEISASLLPPVLE